MDEFFKTPMGRRFYEATMPAMVRAIERHTKATNRLAAAIEKQNGDVSKSVEPESKDEALDD